jgi:prepilin-type N-terminal cleavage/methylation domain-containing protein
MRQSRPIHPSAGVPRGRSVGGFTIPEVMAVLGILAVVLVMVSQVAVWFLRERIQSTDRQAAQELAANILESARARSWEELTPDWAAGQRLPEPLAQRGWRLKVSVEPEKSQPRSKRVIVEIFTLPENKAPTAEPVRLVGLFSARTVTTPGGKP